MDAIAHEFETTVGFFFDGTVYRSVLAELESKCCTPPREEIVDVYAGPDASQRYREITRGASRAWDLKKTVACVEAQTPYVDAEAGSVVFIGGTYKESTERAMTRDEWESTVREDHVTGRCARVGNKHRFCYDRLRIDTSVAFTRVSCGETSAYGGTLEARSKCDTIYYMEIELETEGRLDEERAYATMTSLVVLLFQLVPYETVCRAMMASNSCSIQRERIDNLFDAFKRRFMDYNTCRSRLADDASALPPVLLFVMPKWDGVRVTGLYFCEGYLLMRNAREILSSFRVKLPFGNDTILQLEQIAGADGRDFYVITELLAVMIKSRHTMYQVFGRNNAKHDTGRSIGNVVASISIKRQFDDHRDVCNGYRLLDAQTSLRVLHVLGRTASAGGAGIVALTTVARIDRSENAAVLRRMDDVFSSRSPETRRRRVDRMFDAYLPGLKADAAVAQHCEGLIVAFTARRRRSIPDHGYFKLKYVDTVDLELDLVTFRLTSRDATRYRALGVERDTFTYRGEWRNTRIVVECMYDHDRDALVFVRERYDKTRPDADKKIEAINPKILLNCKWIE